MKKCYYQIIIISTTSEKETTSPPIHTKSSRHRRQTVIMIVIVVSTTTTTTKTSTTTPTTTKASAPGSENGSSSIDARINDGGGLRGGSDASPMFLPPKRQTSTASGSTSTSTSRKMVTSKSSSFSTSPSDTSACLLVMDDNHFLIEWVAYHYHTMNLRNLIVAVDPKSFTSPLHILNRWNDRMSSIVLWENDDDYMAPEEFRNVQSDVEAYFSKTSPELIQHRARQRLFYTKCLQTFKDANVHWTMLIDTDEYMTINYDTAFASPSVDLLSDNDNKKKEKNRTNVTVAAIPPSSLDVPGSIIDFLNENTNNEIPRKIQKQSKGNNDGDNHVTVNDNMPLFVLQSSPCVQIPRIRYVDDLDGSVLNGKWNESDFKEKNNNPSLFDPQDLMTVRYKRHSLHNDLRKNKISKTILDLSRITKDDLDNETGGRRGGSAGVDSIHIPVRKYCQQRRLHIQKPQSMFIIRHYLGTYDQFLYRESDARIDRHKLKHKADHDERWDEYLKQRNMKHFLVDENDGDSNGGGGGNRGLAPWLTGFVAQNDDSIKLLKDVGRLEAKSWRTYQGDPNADRCALLFFGLPRSFQTLVLPSIKTNLLLPNARHNCDVFVHYYQQKDDTKGRRNRGGTIDADSVQLLNQEVKKIASKYGPKSGRNSISVKSHTHGGEVGGSDHTGTARPPIVAFVHDTPEEYWERRGELVQKYQEEIDEYDGKPKYFPWKAQTYTNSSIDNIVRQWHSISTAFNLMEMTAKQLNFEYSRVGMFRSDVMYMTPIDIASLDGGIGVGSGNSTRRFQEPTMDTQNQYFVLAPFATYPVNDRSIYGPYEAVKVWATQRFRLIEERAKLRKQPGFTMHSERFLNDMVLSEMQKLGYKRHTNPDICFLRTRADESVIVSDCTRDGSTRNWDTSKSIRMVNKLVGKQCQPFTMGKKFRFLGCGEQQDYKKRQGKDR
mmetsp:Transcript_24796/g.58837  ORF Transcript_24796/g.58837 Transcript_24796/m.58837 type:complete len:945 (-) Transcript_24796:33-2867(-)